VTATIPTGFGPQGITALAESVWVSNTDGAAVQRIDPLTSQVSETITVPGFPDGLLPVAGSVWVVSQEGPDITRIDPHANTAAETRAVADLERVSTNQSIALADGAFWVPLFDEDRVVKVGIPV
jgi:streptogramin lyase